MLIVFTLTVGGAAESVAHRFSAHVSTIAQGDKSKLKAKS